MPPGALLFQRLFALPTLRARNTRGSVPAALEPVTARALVLRITPRAVRSDDNRCLGRGRSVLRRARNSSGHLATNPGRHSCRHGDRVRRPTAARPAGAGAAEWRTARGRDGADNSPLENGQRLDVDGTLPADLPTGYHDFFASGNETADGQPLRIIVSPGRCFLPADLRLWGWAVQLYATRSRASWGIGDLADLARLGRWARPLGTGMLVVNPLDAVAPTTPQESSPYFPSSRRFLNPIYLAIEAVPGYEQLKGELAPLAAEAQALNAKLQIDRDAVYRLKTAALEKLWRAFAGDEQFDRYKAARGEPLRQFAAYCTLAEKFGGNWHAWEAPLRDAHGPAVRAAMTESADRLRFFQWLQWLLDRQLAAAARELPILKDLPIGASPDGFDAWVWQDVLGRGVAMGAPPDLFNTQGQNWGLPPLVPHALQTARYEPFVDIVRAGLRHAGGLRIDHVIGLFRSFWVPSGFDAQEGAYVRYPVEDLLAILALESQRAGALIIGEDLGTVEPGTRERLAAHDILSYALLYFESNRPSDFPPKALAAITTHDLPTVAGLWSGSDLAEQVALRLSPDPQEERSLRERMGRLTGLPPTASVDEVIRAAHAALAQALRCWWWRRWKMPWRWPSGRTFRTPPAATGRTGRERCRCRSTISPAWPDRRLWGRSCPPTAASSPAAEAMRASAGPRPLLTHCGRRRGLGLQVKRIEDRNFGIDFGQDDQGAGDEALGELRRTEQAVVQRGDERSRADRQKPGDVEDAFGPETFARRRSNCGVVPPVRAHWYPCLMPRSKSVTIGSPIGGEPALPEPRGARFWGASAALSNQEYVTPEITKPIGIEGRAERPWPVGPGYGNGRPVGPWGRGAGITCGPKGQAFLQPSPTG